MSDRFMRQADFVPQSQLQRLRIDVIGTGAIGRQVALQLAALGAQQLRLFDFDCVEISNVTTQGYSQRHDVGLLKVEAMRRAIADIDPQIRIEAVPDRYRPEYGVADATFCCVDTISARKAIWRTVRNRSSFWCDGRMLGEVTRVLAVADESRHELYTASLFPPAEAHVGSCTSRSTIYCANVAAAMMLHQFSRWLRGLPIDSDLSLNLLASELTVAS